MPSKFRLPGIESPPIGGWFVLPSFWKHDFFGVNELGHYSRLVHDGWCGLRTWPTGMIIDEHHTAKWMTMIGNYNKTRLILVVLVNGCTMASNPNSQYSEYYNLTEEPGSVVYVGKARAPFSDVQKSVERCLRDWWALRCIDFREIYTTITRRGSAKEPGNSQNITQNAGGHAPSMWVVRVSYTSTK